METFAMVTTIAVALITAVFGPILVSWARLKMDKCDKSTPMKEALEASTLVDNQIETILNELECDRVWLQQVHNGGHFYPTGKSIQKFSIFYEKATPGLLHLQHTFQNIPVSLFPRVLSKIYKDTELAIDDISTAEDTYGLEYMTTQFGTKSVCMLGLYSLDDHLIGVLGISFKNSHKLKRDEWILIRQKAGVIGTLISEYLYTTTKK